VILLNESKWQERWHSICVDCFEKKIKCIHYEEKRLRLLIVGHNPSSHAWSSGFSYSNPSNRMWKLLTGDFFALKWEGILPSTAVFLDQNSMPFQLGIGMTSIGLEVSKI
jgi:TDG/mug DNA glycosylase family protein